MDTRKLEALHIRPEDGNPYTGIFLKDGTEVADNIATDDDFAAEMVKRWNAYGHLKTTLDGLLKATRRAHSAAQGAGYDYAEGDAHFVGEWIDEARALLNTLKA